MNDGLRHFVGPQRRMVKFLSLTIGLLMVAAATASLIMFRPFLAMSCGVIAAWSIGLFVDAVASEIVEQLRKEQSDKMTR